MLPEVHLALQILPPLIRCLVFTMPTDDVSVILLHINSLGRTFLSLGLVPPALRRIDDVGGLQVPPELLPVLVFADLRLFALASVQQVRSPLVEFSQHVCSLADCGSRFPVDQDVGVAVSLDAVVHIG